MKTRCVDANIMEGPYHMENKFQKEITATNAHARIMAKLHVEMKCVDALTKV